MNAHQYWLESDKDRRDKQDHDRESNLNKERFLLQVAVLETMIYALKELGIDGDHFDFALKKLTKAKHKKVAAAFDLFLELNVEIAEHVRGEVEATAEHFADRHPN